MSDILLEVNDLQVDFLSGKGRVTAVHDVNFSIEKGKTLGIVGESGCGKSVTATSILRLLPKFTSDISKGSILLEGQDLLKMSEREIRQIRGSRISMIFQDPMTALNPVYTIGDQMVELYKAHRKISKREALDRSRQMLEKVGIPSAAQRIREYPHQLSGGMRQRVMIAMALSCNPALLIADEPTTALDVTIQAQILELMTSLQQEFNTAIMMITHDMGVIAEMADNVMVMYAGEAVEYGPLEQIFDHPLHPYTRGLLKSIPRSNEDIEELYTIEGTVPGLENMPQGCRFSNRCSQCRDICRQQSPELVEVEGGGKVRCWEYKEHGKGGRADE